MQPSKTLDHAPTSAPAPALTPAPAPALITNASGTHWPPDARFWSQFAELTAEGRRPHLFKGLLPPDFPGAAEIDGLLRRVHGEPEERRKLRLYVGNDLRRDLVDRFHSAPLAAGCSAFEAMQHAVDEQRLCIVLNETQIWSEALLRASGCFLESLYAARGMPPGGSELVLFAGNYAGTAFGVHRGYEHAFLLHLGPGKKLFHLWPAERYADLTGGYRDVPDCEPLLHAADTVTLEPGDALYLPALWFHIGTQDTYSASVAISLYDYSPEVWLARQLSTLSKRLTQNAFLIDHPNDPGHPERATPYLPATTDANPFADFASRAAALVAERVVPELAEQHWFRRRSNAGFGPGPSVQPPVRALEAHSRVRLLDPFRCCYAKNGAQMSVYLRGQQITLRDDPRLPLLLDRLNAERSMTLSQAGALLEDAWSSDALVGFFGALQRTGGLDVVRV
ncbi:MAG TPA: cupin domain-containing protein [Polyangiaceae bacterium]|nr:cupin domain-containing protein [Polyangiaceae bacterium]